VTNYTNELSPWLLHLISVLFSDYSWSSLDKCCSCHKFVSLEQYACAHRVLLIRNEVSCAVNWWLLLCELKIFPHNYQWTCISVSTVNFVSWTKLQILKCQLIFSCRGKHLDLVFEDLLDFCEPSIFSKCELSSSFWYIEYSSMYTTQWLQISNYALDYHDSCVKQWIKYLADS